RDEIPANDWLVAGDYVAEAWAGDSVSASFDKRWFKGREQFAIKVGESTQLTIPCHIANVLVEVVYDGNVFNTLTDAKFTIGHSRGELVYEGENPGVGYFMMPSSDKDIIWTFEAEGPNGPIKQEGVIENAQPATKYILTVRAGSVDKPIGGTYFNIKIDTTRERVYQDFTIELPPVIDGYDFDANSQDVFMKGQVGRRSIYITASSEITYAELQLKDLSYYLGISSNSESDPDYFSRLSFVGGDDDFLAEVASHGINAIFDPIPGSTETALKINFEEEFTNSLPSGEYEFTYVVEDAKTRKSTLTRILRITDASLALNDVNDYDVWAKEATISADVLQADYGNATFQYRQSGSASWINVAPSDDMTAKLTGLTPGTDYEYRIISDKDDFESEVKIFTTEAALQLPNAGFEDWCIFSDKLWMPYAEGGAQVWDSGNSALKSMLFVANINTNPTSKDTTVKHGGEASAKLSSRTTAGVLAAGNIFMGEFIRVEGGTNGVLGWGYSWSVRPQKLKGWARYSPVSVTNESEDYNDLKKGDMDKGIIYIALLDNSIVQQDSGKNYPVIIKTYNENRQLFDKNANNVIAYGELVFNNATSGDGMAEFEVILTYKRFDVKPSYIMCTASASIGGDYFTGGNGSTLWIDDLELVY
ncbi:MAG: PCMD domain-containing protein, partial [Muribaculaceae bacterium]|nr:PCMD domain-containing protein [Muribaculaceae bacterium]